MIVDMGNVARRHIHWYSMAADVNEVVAAEAAATVAAAELENRSFEPAAAEILDAHSAVLDGFGSFGSSAGAVVGLEEAYYLVSSLSSCSACPAWACRLLLLGSSSAQRHLLGLCCHGLGLHDWLCPADRAMFGVVGSLAAAAAHCSPASKQFD